MKKRVVTTSPDVETLCLAAPLLPNPESFHISGPKHIANVLDHWIAEKMEGEAVVILPRIVEPDAVKPRLQTLSERCAVTWFAEENSMSVREACGGTGVRIVCSERIRDGVMQAYPQCRTVMDRLDSDWKLEARGEAADLIDYIGYKTSLCFMMTTEDDDILEPLPLGEALVEVARRVGRENRGIVPDAELPALHNFRDARSPFIEGRSETIDRLKRRIRQIAQTNMSVMISGETGTGKEAVAFYLHEFSRRNSKPFVSLNCAGLREELIQSELFGHKKGAFTGAVGDEVGLISTANSGTLFLDEIAHMSPEIQADLLRFLETRRYRRVGEAKEQEANVRVIAAAQPDQKGSIRPDLLYRIQEVEIRTPRLKDIPDDLFRIARHIAWRLEPSVESTDQVLNSIDYFQEGQELLKRYDWPGNVRELAALVKRRVLLGDDVLAEIDARVRRSGETPPWSPPAWDIRPVEEIVGDYARTVFKRFGKKHGGELSQNEIARRLGIAVNTLKKHLQSDVE